MDLPTLIQSLNLLPTESPVAIDYETEIPGRGGSVEYYRDDFRVSSVAVAFNLNGAPVSSFVAGEFNVLAVLQAIGSRPIIVHNLMFEYGVTSCRFPNISLNWYSDTMRMAQVADNGGKQFDDEETFFEEDEIEAKRPIGLGLGKVIERWLPSEFHGHKQKAHNYLIINFPEVKKKPGGFLHLLPEDMLREYNCKDAELTLRLFYTFEKFFKGSYDYRFDHDIYISMCKLTAKSKVRGVKIDRRFLITSCEVLNSQTGQIKEKINGMLAPHIQVIEDLNKEEILSSYKTDKGRISVLSRMEADPSLYKFNINSTKQKTRLFVDIMKIEPKFFTKKKQPSFKKSVLGQWGEAGLLLQNRGTTLIALKQAEKLLEKSGHDGRWHIDINPAGTTTGRMAGSGGLNVQAMSRREILLMGGIVADPGHILVSKDLKSGEPSVIAHFSQDPYYRAAILDMVGKPPYYDHNEVLMIDDIYLMGMSVSPLGKIKLKGIFDNYRFNGKGFAEQWVLDPDKITKGVLKRDREMHKALILGVGYEMGAKKMVESSFEKGFTVSLKESKAFIDSWWRLMADVNKLRQQYQYYAKKNGHFVNYFGYRLVPDKPHKAFNYKIQSSVSGLINVLCIKFFSICPEAQFLAIIHDEIIYQVPQIKLAETNEKFDMALKSLNEDLGWTVEIRTGHAEGADFYEAK